jgi:hypothetical protein
VASIPLLAFETGSLLSIQLNELNLVFEFVGVKIAFHSVAIKWVKVFPLFLVSLPWLNSSRMKD